MEKLERRLQADYDTIKQSTMTEIARYREPPYPVHKVLQAALLLLGEDEQTTEVQWDFKITHINYIIMLLILNSSNFPLKTHDLRKLFVWPEMVWGTEDPE